MRKGEADRRWPSLQVGGALLREVPGAGQALRCIPVFKKHTRCADTGTCCAVTSCPASAPEPLWLLMLLWGLQLL